MSAIFLNKREISLFDKGGRNPISISALKQIARDLEENEFDALFDSTKNEGDLLGHSEALAILEIFAEHDVAVTVRTNYHRFKFIRAPLESLIGRSLINDVHFVLDKKSAQDTKTMMIYDRMSEDFARRAWIAFDIEKYHSLDLAGMLKRAIQYRPRVVLEVDIEAPVFDEVVDATIESWRSDLSSIKSSCDLAFNMEAYKRIMPERLGRFLLPEDGKRRPVFYVFNPVSETS